MYKVSPIVAISVVRFVATLVYGLPYFHAFAVRSSLEHSVKQ